VLSFIGTLLTQSLPTFSYVTKELWNVGARVFSKDNLYVPGVLSACIKDLLKCTNPNHSAQLMPHLTRIFFDVMKKKQDLIRNRFHLSMKNYCKFPIEVLCNGKSLPH
jgi:hypothetical protein